MTRRIAVPCLVAFVLSSIAAVAAAQSRFEAAVASSWEVATNVEHLRTLPESINIAGEPVSPAGWLEVGIAALLNVSGIDTRGDAQPTWKMPTVVYPQMILEDAAYGEALDRSVYLDFLTDLATSYPDGAILPSTFELRGAEFRFADAFLMVARLLRFYDAFGYLPAVVDPKISTPRGLFAWEIPAGREAHLSAIQNRNGEEYAATSEFYATSVLDFGLYRLAHDIVGAETDPFAAGQQIFEWSFDRYNRSPYGVNFDITNLTGFVDDSWEMIRNMQGTSGKPSRMNSGLYVAAGLVHGYDSRGYAGLLYTDRTDWYNAEIHAGYGRPPSDNRFFILDGDPIAQDPLAISVASTSSLVAAVDEMTRLDTETVPFRAFWINPSDVVEWGAEAIVEAAVAGGFTAVVLTVKSFVGRLYFVTAGDDNFGGDALEPLVAAAHHADIDVYAAFNTLGDFESGRAGEWGQRYLEPVFGSERNEFFMSPCVPAYVSYLKRLITEVHQNYDIDGLVLARNYVHSDGWANPECGIDGHATDRVKRDRVAAFANDLASHARALDPARKTFYMTAPLLDNSGISLDVYSHDAAPNDLGGDNFDGVILNIHGLAWLTEDNMGFPDPPHTAREAFIDRYLDQSSVPVHTIIHLSKDWMYGPEFFRGLARDYRAHGLAGVVLTAPNSAEGEFGPAFVEQHRAKLSRIRFEDSPPETEVITSTQFHPPLAPTVIVGEPHPNPGRGVIHLTLEVASTGPVEVIVYDMLGRKVATVAQRPFAPGRHDLEWRPEGVSGGVYLLRVDGSWGSATRRVVVDK